MVIQANKITYEPEQLSQVVTSFLNHLQMDFTDTDSYLRWRGEIIPFFAETTTEGRKLLYNPSFTSVLIYGKPTSRYMCRMVLKNIIEQEFSQRIREIEQARQKGGRQ